MGRIEEPKYPVFTVDPVTRYIQIPEEFRFTATERDTQSETVWISMERYFDGEDMANHDCYILYVNAAGEIGRYPAFDKEISDDTIVIPWIIDDRVTAGRGDIRFSLYFETIAEDGTRTYGWQSAVARTKIREGIEPGHDVSERYPTLLDAWLAQMQGLRSESESAIEQARVEADRSKTYADRAEENANRAEAIDAYTKAEVRRRYSPALHGTAAGEAVHITDSAAESDFSRLAVIGRSTQDGEPAPDTPIAIAGVQPASVRVCRKNLANIPDKTVSNAAYVGFADVYSKNAPGVMHMVDKSKIYTLSAYIDNTSGAADSGVKVWYTKNGTISVFNPVSSVSVPVGSKGAATYVIDLTALNWDGVTGLFPGLDLRGSGEGKTVSASQVQFEAGDAATPFEPYAGTDYPLTLTTPMYSLPGGADEIDLVSGAETRRCGVITLDGTETWMVRKANATSASFSTPVSNVAIGAAYPAISTIGFRAGRYGVDGYEGTTSDSGTSSRPQISVLYSRIGSSAEDTDADKISKFKAWLASHPVTLVYQLANPVTADHARADIAQPTPEANVSADGAPVDVTYSRDLQKAFDTLQAAILAAGSN